MRNMLVGVLIALTLVMVGCTQPSQATPQPSGAGATATLPGGGSGYDGNYPQQKNSGYAVFAITDAAADMGGVSSVKVTVDSIRVHSATQGWMIVTSTRKTYDLLALKSQGKLEFAGNATLPAGTYDQVRLDVSQVIVADASGNHQAKVPSGQIRFNGITKVAANATSSVTVDFAADASLHVTGKGEYIFAPVIHMESRKNAEVELRGSGRVEVRGGELVTEADVGMDASGNMGTGLGIASNADLYIEGGRIRLGNGRLAIKTAVVEIVSLNPTGNSTAKGNLIIGGSAAWRGRTS